jgi:hypothetical protein
MTETGTRKGQDGMSARAVGTVLASCALLALAACDNTSSGAKTEESSSERISAGLDVCAQATNEFSQQVCANRSLVGLDNQVRETLVAEAANVSDAGAAMLVQNQQRWREAQRVSCGILDAETAPTPEQQQCLEAEFRARARDAVDAVQDIGPYTFQRMELVDATPVTAEAASDLGLGDNPPNAVVRNIRFPRIDGEQTPEIRRFNELVAQEPQFRLEDATNETVTYDIAFAGPELVSVRFSYAQDALGAANSTTSVRAVNVVMTEGRALAATDVFTARSGWENFITDRAVAAIGREFSDYTNFPPRRDVYETATKPHLWLITERGLVLLFPPLSFGGSHADGGTEVTIPWSDLRPYLNPAAPAPIRPSA